jgi:hypothetical protein
LVFPSATDFDRSASMDFFVIFSGIALPRVLAKYSLRTRRA